MKSNNITFIGLLLCIVTTFALLGCNDSKYGDSNIEIGRGEMYHFAHQGNLVNTIRAKVTLKHTSGPPVTLYIMDEANWKLCQINGPDGIANMLAGDSTTLKPQPVYTFSANLSQQETDWIDIPIRDNVFFVISQNTGNSKEKSKCSARIAVKIAD